MTPIKFLKSSFRLLWNSWQNPNPERQEAMILDFCLEHLMCKPIVYTDQYELKYILYPGQNAKVYFENLGNYEVGETQFCLQTIKPGMITFDVGSNIGLYTLLFAKLVGSKGQVHCFEPEQKNYQKLLTNLTLNNYQNILANYYAVFSESKTLELNVFPDSVNSWHSLGKPEMADPWQSGKKMIPINKQKVEGVSLDDYCYQHKIDKIDFLKIDVEGAELEVLQGCKRLFTEKKIEQIMFEVSLPQIESMGHNQEEIFSYLKNNAFECYPILSDGNLGESITSITSKYGNYIAKKKD